MTFKISVCLRALRMLDRSNGKAIQQIVIRTAILIIVLSHVAITLALMLYCRPVRKAWNPHIKGKCLSVGPLFYGTAAATILCDLIAFSMLISALLAIKNLDPKVTPRSTVDSKKTLRLTVSLFFGIFTTICSVVRTIQIREVLETGDSTMLILWGVIEACVGVLPYMSFRSQDFDANTSWQAITSSIPTLNAMFSGLWKSGTSAAKKCHSTDRYCELPGTGSRPDDSVNLIGITRETDIVMRSEVVKDGFQESSTRHGW